MVEIELRSALLPEMFSAEIDPANHLLKITFGLRVGRDEAAACFERVKSLLSQLQPGFSMLTNLTGLETMDLACEPFIDQTMDACNCAGVQRVVRIVPDPNKDIGFGIMSLFHYGPTVRIVTCSTSEEAEKILGMQVGST